MSSTSPALAISTSSGVRVLPTMASRNGVAVSSKGPSSFGCSRERSLEMDVMSLRADWRVAPGLSRPTIVR
jgi:hypothetical protein